MRTYIIAEIGVNHNGDLERAKDMVTKALICGADCVKFQTFWGLKGLERYEFDENQWMRLKEHADKMGIDFMSTAHWGSPLCGYKDSDYPVIDFVDTLVKTHKIASPYLTNENYVRHIALKGKPVFLSTGSITNDDRMANNSEISQALEWLCDVPTTLLHCVSKYPAEDGKYDRMKELRKEFGRPVGISDHTDRTKIPPMAVVEKHFKIDEDCIDASVSLNLGQFKMMVEFIRNFEKTYATF